MKSCLKRKINKKSKLGFHKSLSKIWAVCLISVVIILPTYFNWNLKYGLLAEVSELNELLPLICATIANKIYVLKTDLSPNCLDV